MARAYVGVETSFDGDVYLGAGLENFDADSIRAGIASDPWYAQLPRGGSQGGAVLAALLAGSPKARTWSRWIDFQTKQSLPSIRASAWC